MTTTLAVLDAAIPEQIRTNPGEMQDVQVIWTGVNIDELEARATKLRPNVLILDLDLLGPDPIERTRVLQKHVASELVLLLYRFAKRDLINQFADLGTRPVKAPMSLRALRTQMMSVIIRDIFQKGDRVKQPSDVPALPTPPVRAFTPAQLGRLQEINSAVDCECPNHISDLLQRLHAFEDYSMRCESKNDKDAQVHHMLYVQTGQARHILEKALGVLLQHENIQL